MKDSRKYTVLMSLAAVGFVISLLAGLSERIDFLQSLCGFLSGSCKETVEVKVLFVPLWLWGALFYATVTFLAARKGPLIAWLVAAGLGVEATLGWIMFSSGAACVYCIGSLLVVVAMAVTVAFMRPQFWQSLAIVLLFVLVSQGMLADELGKSVQASLQEVAARVGDEVITWDELELPIAVSVQGHREQIYKMEKDRLELLLAERLLQKEALASGITIDELVNKAVPKDKVQISEEEVASYYQDNMDRWKEWPGSIEELKKRIRVQLEQERRYRMVYDFAKSLSPRYGVETFLKAPQLRTAAIDTTGCPALGPESAMVTVVEFSDYECPVCRSSHEVSLRMRERYKGRLRWVFKDFPLKRHQHAQLAAEAARCAGEQGRYWEFQDVLYGTTSGLEKNRISEYAKQSGLNEGQFATCLDSGKHKEKVEKDVADGKKTGVSSTPTFVINGKLISGGMSEERFQQILDAEFEQTAKRNTGG